MWRWLRSVDVPLVLLFTVLGAAGCGMYALLGPELAACVGGALGFTVGLALSATGTGAG